MKILWVKAGKLLPVDTGGKIRSYNLLRQLIAARHETVLLSYYGGARDEAYEAEIEKHLPGALTIHTAAPDTTTLERSLHYLRCLPLAAPFAVAKFTSPKVARTIAAWDRERRFDVVVCDFLAASLNFPRTLATPSVLFQHNVESILWQRQAEHEPHPVKRLVFKLEAAKMLHYERATVKRFDHIIAVSDNDREQMSEMTDAARISVVPTGVDLQLYRAAATTAKTTAPPDLEHHAHVNVDEKFGGEKSPTSPQPLIVFLGSMDWEANIDGVDYFCREIFPQVRAAVPEARFRIVGRKPHARVLKLASDSVEVTGTVPSVIEHLQEATVFIVPLRVGGGTRLKIYEAMAVGKAIVSTTIGAEGLDVHHGQDIILADDPQGFADAVVKLVRDESERRRLEKAAARLAAQYDWPIIARRFEETLARVAQESARKRHDVPANRRSVEV
ncbi:MAG: glycosyltransferase family 4 protein [Pyrinomonadaceae bacterium]